MTLSLHVIEEDIVKAYLHWSGKVMRFMPEDVKTLFPKIFNMKYGDNKEFMSRQVVDGFIKQMKETLRDREFDTFLNSF